MRGLVSDIRHAFRLYVATPVVSAIAVVLLAIAIAAVSSFVSLYADLALKPTAAFERGDRIVTIGQTDGTSLTDLPLRLVDRIANEATSLDAIGGTLVVPARFTVGAERAPVFVAYATRDLFSGLDPRLRLGRGFARADHAPDAEPVTVLSYDYWQEKFGGSDDVIGRTILLTGRAPGGSPGAPAEVTAEFRIVGVMSAEGSKLSRYQADIYLPVGRAAEIFLGGIEQARDFYTVLTFGRVADHVGLKAVIGELNARYVEADDASYLREGRTINALDGIVRNVAARRDALRQLRLFLAGSLLLAVVAAANVSLFLLARAPGRRRELGIRMAVGAPLRRLMRQLASEAVVLVAAAVALGVFVSIWTSSLLSGLSFLTYADWNDVTVLNWRVLGIVGAFALALATAVALTPVLGVRRLGIAGSSRRIAARATPFQRLVCTTQLAVSGAVVAAAVAFAWVLASLIFADPGYETRDRYVLTLASDDGQPISTDFGVVVDTDRWRETIEGIPGVEAVTFSNHVPGGVVSPFNYGFEGPDGSVQIQAMGVLADARYVDVLGLDLVYGRSPAGNQPDAMLVNQMLARALFGREDVVGERFPGVVRGADNPEIIGVLRDLSFYHPNDDVYPLLIMPLSAFFRGARLAVIESGLPLPDLRRDVAAAIEAGDLEFGIEDLRPLASLRFDLLAPDRARGVLTLAIAAVVVFLAAFGFYGTQRFLVSAGRREYAIRASLGAGPRALARLVIRRGLGLGLPGLALGALLAFIAVAWLRDNYVPRDVSPGFVTVGVVMGLIFLVLAASLAPARRARRMLPAPLLRED